MSSIEPFPGAAPDSHPLRDETDLLRAAAASGNAAVMGEVGQRDIRAELEAIRPGLPIDLHRAAHQLDRLSPILQKRKLPIVPKPMERQLHNQRLYQQRMLASLEGRGRERASEEGENNSLARAAMFLADPDLVQRYLIIMHGGASRAESDFIHFFQEAYGQDPEELAYVCDLVRSSIDKGRIAAGREREVHGPDGRYMGHI